jgi:hypothetical protein
MICSGVNGAVSSAYMDWSRAPLGDWVQCHMGSWGRRALLWWRGRRGGRVGEVSSASAKSVACSVFQILYLFIIGLLVFDVWGSVAVQNRQAARLRLFLKLDCELPIDDCYHVGISNRKGAVGHVTCSDAITKDYIPKENASVAMSGLEAYNYSGEAHYSSCYH